MKLFGRRYDDCQPVQIDVAKGKITRVTPYAGRVEDSDAWPWVAPGLVDIQINGYRGQEFSSATLTPEKVLEIIRTYDSFGLVRCCPTLFTQSFEVLRHALKTISAACQSSPEVARRIAGVHVEGPYLSKDDGPRGAHPPEYCRRPDWDEFQRLQEAADGRIRIHTMAVEFDEAPQFIRRVVASGVVVAIGHTSADSDQIRVAVDAGASVSTHLGNGAHGMLRRHPNYIWDQLAEDRLIATLIVDGHHLPAEVVKTFIRAKTPQRCVLISDISGLAGLPLGRHHANHGEVEILPGGRLVVAGQRQILAGASLPIGTGVANVMQFAGVSLEEAVLMATARPAQLLGLPPGGLAPGDPADLVLFDLVEPAAASHGDRQEDQAAGARFGVRSTILDGQTIWGSIWQPA